MHEWELTLFYYEHILVMMPSRNSPSIDVGSFPFALASSGGLFRISPSLGGQANPRGGCEANIPLRTSRPIQGCGPNPHFVAFDFYYFHLVFLLAATLRSGEDFGRQNGQVREWKRTEDGRGRGKKL